jgi:hypothetical protein
MVEIILIGTIIYLISVDSNYRETKRLKEITLKTLRRK